ncbi:VCBS repeat-containing protein [Wenyingzhuangia sp. IMCC45574]
MRILGFSFVVVCLLASCKKENKKQFTLLSSDKTGITFSNDITENDKLNYFTYPYMYMGGGVSVGDVNNDGLEDLFFTANMKPNALYLNKGDLRFEDITKKANVEGDEGWFTGATMVDINNDGFLDIYVSVSGKGEKRNNLLYVNKGLDDNGNVSFSEQGAAYGINHNGHTTQSTFFDYDNDGDLDLYLANYPPTPFNTHVSTYQQKMNNPVLEDSDILYRNNGDGTFSDVTVEAGVLNFGLSLSATVADINNDGFKDVYISNDFESSDFVYINNGNGTFRQVLKETIKHTAQYGMGVDIADFNNDALLDIGQVDMTPEDNMRSKANMGSMNPYSFTSMVDAGLHYQYMQNCLQLNRGVQPNGNPAFSEVSRIAGIATTDWSWSILFSDLDNDGWKDITISNGTRRDINNRDYFLSFKERNHFGSVKLTAEEVNKIPSEKVSNYVYRNNGDYTFQNKVKDWGWEEKTFSNGAAYADLDNDGDLDFVINNIDQQVSVYENNNAAKNNFLQIELKGTKENRNGLGAKIYISTNGLSQYQELTLTRGFQSSVSPKIHFGTGKEKIVDEVKVLWPDGKVSQLKEVKTNQSLEIFYKTAVQGKSSSRIANKTFKTVSPDSLGVDFVHQEDDYNDYYHEPLLPHSTSMLGSGVTVADVNSDTLDDFYVGGASGQSGVLYIQNTSGKFYKSNVEVFSKDKEKEDMGALFFDVDGDGDKDLYVVSGGNDKTKGIEIFQDRLYVNDGAGNFNKSEKGLPKITSSGSRVVAGDYDKDGDLDLFVGGRLVPGQYPWPSKSYVLNNNGGVFTDVTEKIAPDFTNIGMITDAVWSDFDNNGSLDLILVGEWTEVQFYSNTENGFVNVTEATGLVDNSGWWSSIVADDFDNDGDLDYVVGNLGLNYKYQASVAEPFEVFADDFDNNQRKDIVLSYYNFGKLFPVRGKSCSTQQIPSLKKKFESYTTFAASDVAGVYGKEKLDKAEIHYKAKNFASVYIENLGGGKFRKRKLPNVAQFSMVNRVIAKDVDKDGVKDLVLTGNLFSSEIETPRNDAGMGVFLKGDDKGGFKEVSNTSSGLMIDGDVKDMSSVTIKNKQYLLVIKNNDSPQFICVN